MTGHRIFTPKQPNSTLHRLTVKKEIVVHQITLNGVSAPHPTVTLDAVDKKLTGSEVHSVGTHFPNTVQFFIIATESSTIFFGKVFVLHRYLTYLYPRFMSDIDVAESLTVFQGIFVFDTGQRGCLADGKISDLSCFQLQFIQCFAVCLVFRLFRTFTVIDVDDTFTGEILQSEVTECFFSEIIEDASFGLCSTGGGLMECPHQSELGRELCGSVKVPAAGIHIDGG